MSRKRQRRSVDASEVMPPTLFALASAPSLQARSGAVPHLTSISSPAKVRVPPHFSVGRRREKTRHEHEKFVTCRDRRFRKRWAQKPRRDTRTSDCLPDFLRAMSRRDCARRMRPRKASRGACLPANATHSACFTEQFSAPYTSRCRTSARRTVRGEHRTDTTECQADHPPSAPVGRRSQWFAPHTLGAPARTCAEKYSNTIQEKKTPRPKIKRWTPAAFAGHKKSRCDVSRS